ncbi:hypothetical protein QOM18_25940, partial [Serratia marcescens]|uniref:hypothetical protein n=1 Tax=Serratia marcescens TaxID=615 RepID=UPI0024C47E3E
EADGVGVTFKAEHWPDNPVRGTLSGATSRQREQGWYYTLSPGAHDTSGEAWPLRLAADSPALVVDTVSGDPPRAAYFSLAGVNYWYDLNTPLKENDVMVIPFAVQVHHALTREDSVPDEGVTSHFTLQLSWR